MYDDLNPTCEVKYNEQLFLGKDDGKNFDKTKDIKIIIMILLLNICLSSTFIVSFDIIESFKCCRINETSRIMTCSVISVSFNLSSKVISL